MYWDISVFQSVLNEMCFRVFFFKLIESYKTPEGVYQR